MSTVEEMSCIGPHYSIWFHTPALLQVYTKKFCSSITYADQSIILQLLENITSRVFILGDKKNLVSYSRAVLGQPTVRAPLRGSDLLCTFFSPRTSSSTTFYCEFDPQLMARPVQTPNTGAFTVKNWAHEFVLYVSFNNKYLRLVCYRCPAF